MEKLKQFYLDFTYFLGTCIVLFYIYISSSSTETFFSRFDILKIIGFSLLFAVVKFFWDSHALEQIEYLKKEVERLENELKKKDIQN